MKYLDYVTLRDVSWDTDPYLCSIFLCGPILEWKLSKHSWRHILVFRTNDSAICWTCRDGIRKSFSCKQCGKSWCQSVETKTIPASYDVYSCSSGPA